MSKEEREKFEMCLGRLAAKKRFSSLIITTRDWVVSKWVEGGR